MKRLSPLFFALLATGAQATMVAHYNMEQGGSPLVDQAGGQTAAAVDGGHQYGLAGPAGFGSAAGLTTNGSWQLSVADSAELNLANNMTVAAWIYLDSAVVAGKAGLNSNMARIIGDDVAWDGDGWSFGLRNHSSMLFTKNGVVDADDFSATVPADQWVHVAATVSSTNGITYYINGGVAGGFNNTANNNTGLGNNGVADPYAIGRSYSNAQQQWFPGGLDEVKVFDTVLTQPEVAALMVPEPSSLLLLASGLLSGVMIRRRR